MKLEHPAETPETVETAQKPLPDRKRPVLVYIMILFIAAFLLMAFSFLMHQRSNEQVLGELHTSVNLLEDYQQALEANNRLTGQVADLEQELSAATTALETAKADLKALQAQYDMLEGSVANRTMELSLLETLHEAEHRIERGDYSGARALLDDWADGVLEEELAKYDAMQAHYNPGRGQLTPCYEAILAALEAAEQTPEP